METSLGSRLVLDRYRMESADGSDGHAARAWDERLRRMVVLHRFSSAGRGPDASKTPIDTSNARVLAGHDAPNVVPILDVGIDGKQLIVVTEPFEGVSLDAWLEQAHSLDNVLRVFGDLTRGLRVLVESGFVPDPGEAMGAVVGPDGQLRVATFQAVSIGSSDRSADRVWQMLERQLDRDSASRRVRTRFRWLRGLVSARRRFGDSFRPGEVAVWTAGEICRLAELEQLCDQLRQIASIRTAPRRVAMLVLMVAIALVVVIGMSAFDNGPSSPFRGVHSAPKRVKANPPAAVQHRVTDLVQPPSLALLDRAFEPHLRDALPAEEWLMRLAELSQAGCRPPNWEDATLDGDMWELELPCSERGLIMRIAVTPRPPYRIASLSHFARPDSEERERLRAKLEAWINEPSVERYRDLVPTIQPWWSDSRQELHRQAHLQKQATLAPIREAVGQCKLGEFLPGGGEGFYDASVVCERGTWHVRARFGFSRTLEGPGTRIVSLVLSPP